jgi:ankyrin repeat protein
MGIAIKSIGGNVMKYQNKEVTKYQTKPTQAFVYHAILCYIQDQKSNVVECISTLDESSILARSPNGHSHLTDILHLSFKMTKNQPAQKCLYLMDLLLSRAKNIGPYVLESLLTQADNSGFTPMHDALKSGHPEIVLFYFKTLWTAVDEGSIASKIYGDLLRKCNRTGFTPMHDAFKSSNPKIAHIFLSAVRKAVSEEWITRKDYKTLLLASTQKGFTPVHDLIKFGNLDNLKVYLSELGFYIEGWVQQTVMLELTPKDYQDLLLKPDPTGFTILHKALKSGNPEIVGICFNMVQQVVEKGWITPENYANLLLTINSGGFTSLHDVLKSGNTEITRIYFEAVLQQALLKKKWITKKAYASLLQSPNKAGFTPLLVALISGNSEIVHIYFDVLAQAVKERWISEDAYLELLFKSNEAGDTPSHCALRSGNSEIVNIYFSAALQAAKNGWSKWTDERKQAFLNLLRSPNKAGFTPAHDALKSGNPEIGRIYFDALAQAVKVSWIKEDAYLDLLLKPNEAGFTPLHEALKFGNVENMAVYFAAVAQAVKNGWDKWTDERKKAYRDWLLKPNREGFTPLHEALIAGNLKNLQVYLEAVLQAVEEGWISEDAFRDLLLNPNLAGDTPLHCALKSRNPENMAFYFNVVQRAVENRLLSSKYNETYKEVYVAWLLKPNLDGFTPLHEILISGNSENLRVYLEAVQQAADEKWISEDAFLDLLFQPNAAGFTLLHNALISDNTENLRVYLKVVAQAVKNGWGKWTDERKQAYRDWLLKSNREGFTPLHEALIAGNLESLQVYLEAIQQAVDEGWISKEAYLGLLLSQTKAGYTPLHASLSSKDGTPESLALYLNKLEEVYTNKWITDKDVYLRMLLGPNNAGYPPLHNGLKSGNHANLIFYFNQLEKMIEKLKWMDAKTYRDLLIEPKVGFTSLNQVLISGDPDKVELYLERLHKYVERRWVIESDYLDLLVKPTKDGFTPLHQAADSNSPVVFRFFSIELKRVLSPQNYYKAFSCRTKNGIRVRCNPHHSNADIINDLIKDEIAIACDSLSSSRISHTLPSAFFHGPKEKNSGYSERGNQRVGRGGKMENRTRGSHRRGRGNRL